MSQRGRFLKFLIIICALTITGCQNYVADLASISKELGLAAPAPILSDGVFINGSNNIKFSPCRETDGEIAVRGQCINGEECTDSLVQIGNTCPTNSSDCIPGAQCVGSVNGTLTTGGQFPAATWQICRNGVSNASAVPTSFQSGNEPMNFSAALLTHLNGMYSTNYEYAKLPACPAKTITEAALRRTFGGPAGIYNGTGCTGNQVPYRPNGENGPTLCGAIKYENGKCTDPAGNPISSLAECLEKSTCPPEQNPVVNGQGQIVCDSRPKKQRCACGTNWVDVDPTTGKDICAPGKPADGNCQN